MLKIILQSSLLLFFITMITGGVYPLLVTGVGQLFFFHKAKGSLIVENQKVIGSELIGQSFTQPYYFKGRPSAVSYQTVPSGASNWGPTNKDLTNRIQRLRLEWAKKLDISPAHVPEELVTTSGSGLDPHLSPESVKIQINPIARERNLSLEQTEKLRLLVDEHIEKRSVGFLGEPVVNVLLLNQALDQHLGQPVPQKSLNMLEFTHERSH